MAEPESTAEPEGTSEPESEVTPEAESEVIPEVEPEDWTQPEAEGEGWPEPEPEWDIAYEEWGPAWPLHVYLFASLYATVAILSLISILHFCKSRKTLSTGKLTVFLQTMLFTFSFLRSLVMFMDPYSTTDVMPSRVFSAFWSLAIPGLTASFSFLLLVLLDTTKMTLGPPRFQRLSSILTFTFCHFAIVMTSDLVYSFNNSCKPLLLFCQILFIVYGTALCAGYSYAGYKIYNNCLAAAVQDDGSSRIHRLTRVCFSASFASFAICVTHIYAASSEFGVYSDSKTVGAWPWWSLQTLLRIEELVSCCIVLVVAIRIPFKKEIAAAISKCFNKSCSSNKVHIIFIPTQDATPAGHTFKTSDMSKDVSAITPLEYLSQPEKDVTDNNTVERLSDSNKNSEKSNMMPSNTSEIVTANIPGECLLRRDLETDVGVDTGDIKVDRDTRRRGSSANSRTEASDN